MTTWTTRAFPLALVLALGACKSDDKTDDGETDTTPAETDTTKHTGETGTTGYQPTSFTYMMDFAIDADGNPADVGTGDTAIGPVLTITTEDDGGDSCSIFYLIDKDQYASVGQTAPGETDTDTDTSSAGNADTLAWLDAHGAQWGFRIAANHYTAALSTSADERCDELTVDYLNTLLETTYTDVAEAVLQLGGTNPMFMGLNTRPTPEILTALEGSGIDADQVLGGFITFPFQFQQQGGGLTDTSDGFGLWADLGEDNLPKDDGAGNLALNDADDAFTPETGLASEGYYRAFGATITFSSN